MDLVGKDDPPHAKYCSSPAANDFCENILRRSIVINIIPAPRKLLAIPSAVWIIHENSRLLPGFEMVGRHLSSLARIRAAFCTEAGNGFSCSSVSLRSTYARLVANPESSQGFYRCRISQDW